MFNSQFIASLCDLCTRALHNATCLCDLWHGGGGDGGGKVVVVVATVAVVEVVVVVLVLVTINTMPILSCINPTHRVQ